MELKSAKFIISVADSAMCQDYAMPEIAIAGKSNVGKSSLINFLTNHGSLARTSQKPGRTKLLNYFEVNKGQFMLVDLPGYGFARVSDEEKLRWGKLVEGYLACSKNLKNVFLLVDIRHEPGVLDKQMVAYLHHFRVPFTIIATKSDKLSKMQIIKQRKIIANAFVLGEENILVSSSLKKEGREEIAKRIEQFL